jgi:hypothetical protein
MTIFSPRAGNYRLAAACAGLLFAAPTFGQLDRTITSQTDVDRAAAQAQGQINDVRDRTQDAAARYAQFLAEAESLEKFNEQLAEQVRSQQDEIASIEQQLVDIETTNREVQPLMQKMIDTLEQFVALDVPFFLEERTNRVQNLKDLMGRADVAISEKYRRLLEAYQIELEYGRVLEAYEGTVTRDGQELTAEFVHLGRVALMYRTLDGAETGYWDAEQRTWVADDSYASDIEEAIRVARQEGAPDLLRVPVPAPVGASQ